MLVQYTPLSALTEAELQRLRQQVGTRPIQGHVLFEGRSLQGAEVAARQRVWEAEARGRGRQTLLG